MHRYWTISVAGIMSVWLAGCQCNDDGLNLKDADKDGHSALTDCNDQDPDINPGAEEVCDGVDNNCDGEVDEGLAITMYADTDGDNHGDINAPQEVCEETEGFVTSSDDCDDTNAAIHPGAEEICDDLDNDCDLEIDEGLDSTYFLDSDADGFGDPDVSISDCEAPEGYVEDNTDCEDSEPTIYPGAPEICDDGIDQDCDTLDQPCKIDDWISLDGDADISFAGWDAGEQTGNAVDIIPDFDGDGIGEVLIGAYGRDYPSNYSGAAYMIDFNASFPWRGLIQLKDEHTYYERWMFQPESGGDQLGSDVAYAGDVDGDGSPDVMVSSPRNTDGAGHGSIALFLSSDLSGTTGDIYTSDASAILRGSTSAGRAGNSVHRAGDLNGDGFDDIVIGAFFANVPYTQQGRAYILYGCETGLGGCYPDGTSFTANYPWKSAAAGVGLADVADAMVEGLKWDTRAGSAVSGAGDFNGDGTDDLIIGSSYESAPKTESGAAYIITEFPIISTSIDSAASTKLSGESYHHWVGSSVDMAGDLNDDGYADVLVGAPGYGNNNQGRAYLVLGQVNVDDMVLSEADTVFVSDGNYYQAGHAVEGLGDITGNGIPSFAITATHGRGLSNEENAGRVYIFHDAPSGEVLLSQTVDTYSGAILIGTKKGGKVGSDIAGGDINGDGYNDVLIGAQVFNSTGHAFVLLGGPL